MLYQGWNLAFTAFPIMWWSVCDLEHEKQVFLDKPKLYEIGLQNQCFNTKIFFQDISQAVVNAYLISAACFYGEDGQVVNRFGRNGSFWVDGTMVYTVIVVVCNLKILHKSNNHTWITYFLIFGSILFYEFWFGLESTSTWFP